MIICAVVLLLTAALIWVMPAFSMTGSRQTLEEAFAWQSDHYDTSFYAELEKSEYTVSAEDGYVLHAELLKNPEETTDYVIISHGYTDNRMGALKYMPGLLLDLADIGSRIRYHYAIKDMRPIDSLADNTVPVLFIHGAEDDFILPENSEAMAAATKGRSELCLIPGAGHAESVLKEPEMYEETLREFLGKLTKGRQS